MNVGIDDLILGWSLYVTYQDHMSGYMSSHMMRSCLLSRVDIMGLLGPVTLTLYLYCIITNVLAWQVASIVDRNMIAGIAIVKKVLK